MISLPLLALLICNYVAIGLLPVLFFRRDGQYNLRWLATAAPFFIVPATLLLAAFGVLETPVAIGAAVQFSGEVIAVLLSVLSIALLAMTVGAHRVPLALWHQDNDAPAQLVTWGPYARVRHPFYTSFILALAAAVIALPHALTLACLAYTVIALTVTARREERRLAGSDLGADYRDYIAATGRFFPRFG